MWGSEFLQYNTYRDERQPSSAFESHLQLSNQHHHHHHHHPPNLANLHYQTMEEEMVKAYDKFASWPAMEAELKEAACSGEVGFLRAVVELGKLPAYFLCRFIPTDDNEEVEPYAGNILHLALWHNRIDFAKAVLMRLPEDVVHRLLCQQETVGQLIPNWNPLHLAISRGYQNIVELIVQCHEGKPSILRRLNGMKPLQRCPDQVFSARDSQGRTPELLAIEKGITFLKSHENWPAMNPELKKAASKSDIKFLRDAIAKLSNLKPQANYFLTRFIPTDTHEKEHYAGNILHLAVWHYRFELVRDAICRLPEDVVDQLLCQQETAGQLCCWNPLHVAGTHFI